MAGKPTGSNESLPIGAVIAVGALAIFIAIVLIQTVLSAVFGLLKIVLFIAVLAGTAFAVLSAKSDR